MATRKVRIQEKTGASSTDLLHPETEAGIVTYSNTSSGLTATDVQSAIDELNTAVSNAGKVDDVKISNGTTSTSVVSNKVAEIVTNSTYNASTNKIATMSDLPTDTWRPVKLEGTQKLSSATNTNALDFVAGSNISITESNGAFTFAVTGLSGAMQFIGVSTTDPKGSSGATVSGHSSWHTGEVVIYQRTGETGYEEYVNIDGSNTSSSWELLGDSDDYALKTISISAGTGLSGGGDLTQNRTLSLGDTYGDTKNPYGSKTQHYVLAAPSSANGVPSFRALVAGDLPDLSGTYQPLDADLTAIAGLSGTSGLLKKTAANTWSLDTSTYLTGNQTITLSGDATGSGTTSIALTLANTGITAGTYSAVTVDAKGRATAGYQSLEYGSKSGTNTPSNNLVTGGLFFEEI